MRRLIIKRLWSGITVESGFTLLEMLAALALTAMVSTVVASLLFTTLATRRNIQQRTDGHESLRIAATMIMEDTRFAVQVQCLDWGAALQLLTPQGSTVSYWFKNVDDTPDPNRLHRRELLGGDVKDAVVGWNMVPLDLNSGTGTGFTCLTGINPAKKAAGAHLVQAPLQGQTNPTALDVMALLR